MEDILMDIQDWRLDLILRSIRQEALLREILFRSVSDEAHRTGEPLDALMKKIEMKVEKEVREIALKNQMKM